jgi:hypothetical protein
MNNYPDLTSRRFRGFLPVVIDVETGGFLSNTDALLEIAAVIIEVDSEGRVRRGVTHAFNVEPFEGSRLDPASLQVTGIDPFSPLRQAITEAAEGHHAGVRAKGQAEGLQGLGIACQNVRTLQEGGPNGIGTGIFRRLCLACPAGTIAAGGSAACASAARTGTYSRGSAPPPRDASACASRTSYAPSAAA